MGLEPGDFDIQPTPIAVELKIIAAAEWKSSGTEILRLARIDLKNAQSDAATLRAVARWSSLDRFNSLAKHEGLPMLAFTLFIFWSTNMTCWLIGAFWSRLVWPKRRFALS